MRISDDRYSRDRQRFDLALRFIQHEARTRTIRTWTGLTDDRIRKLYRCYMADDAGRGITRHRGKSPQLIAFFMRTPRHAAGNRGAGQRLLPAGGHAGGAGGRRRAPLPGMQRGEALCEAFEAYRMLVPCPRISFEHAVFLVTALARGR